MQAVPMNVSGRKDEILEKIDEFVKDYDAVEGYGWMHSVKPAVEKFLSDSDYKDARRVDVSASGGENKEGVLTISLQIHVFPQNG